MFYQMIANACARWLASPDCTVRDLVAYIEQRGQLRDAQIGAIKTYLFLKVGCGCRPLVELFSEGRFNCADISEFALPDSVKNQLRQDPAAAALMEYACLKNASGEQVSPKLAELLRQNPGSVDARRFFRDAFYGVSYTDYLFSLPMGAGKTFLMAAFIYLDLYFALNEPHDPCFAHNFIILAPSGLKSSVIPSLKTIQNFDPTWVIPEPAASAVKRRMIFEVLDQEKTARKSNKTKNPNVQKIANHQPLSELFGLVAVTNAEKVILDRIKESRGQISLFEDSDDEKDRQANELRNLIGRLPALSVFIDEVHHAVSDEIKLRAVVSKWADVGAVNSVVGFSGTPYLEKAEKITVAEGLSVATAEITNIVNFYPLINGVGNFLKRPVVKIAEEADSGVIIENGVRAFLDSYRDTVYANGTCAKLGIYCGTIEKLEQTVYPLVSRIVAEYGLAGDSILRFHKGNKQYPQPADSQMQFDSLDKPFSHIRIILLVQVGKEGWDCRSLTGIILSQEGDCPRNMVLQTSCRCLRQADKDRVETALIYLNSGNAEKLNAQLQQQHHISLREFASGNPEGTKLERYDRTAYLRLPKLNFCQLYVHYSSVTTQEADPAQDIPTAMSGAQKAAFSVITTDLSMEPLTREIDRTERGDTPAVFSAWLYSITKASFGALSMAELRRHEALLRDVFEKITVEKGSGRVFSSAYDRAAVEANIRKAFCEKRSFSSAEELIPEEASLLNIANFRPEIRTDSPEDYYPTQDVVKNIVQDDAGKFRRDPKLDEAIRLLEETGNSRLAEDLRQKNASHPQKDRSFHYLPYHLDSGFEKSFLEEVLPLLTSPELKPLNLELYYNGDKAMTEFKIKCYKTAGGRHQYIGLYTPDFLLIQRKDGRIHKAIILETKGGLYANDPHFKDRRAFMETEFIRQNNAAFGYERFEYLYLEDSLAPAQLRETVDQKIREFFGGEK